MVRAPSGRFRPVLIGLFFAAFATFSLLLKTELRKEKSPLEGLPLGKAMPDFTLTDTHGSEVTLKSRIEAKPKMVVIHFWASWCAPCRLEMPELEALYQADRQRGLVILAVDEDREPEKLEAYLREKPVSFPVLIDRDGKLAESLGIRVFPTSILVPANGRILSVVEGLDQYMRFRVEGSLAPLAVGGKGEAGAASRAAPVSAAPKEGEKK